MKNTAEKETFVSYLSRYVGIGLISGSIVHAGTLGGGSLRYIILISIGALLFMFGTFLETKKEVLTTRFIVTSVLLSMGVGMVSGGTQHFIDGPLYAAFLIPTGLFVGYIMFLFRKGSEHLSIKKNSQSLHALNTSFLYTL